jgi:glycosyltransferase involved in cell wall biosynthesis
VIVVPSMVDGMPLVVLESLAAGRPVVASRVGAIPEVIRHGFNGFLCDSGDAEQFLTCIDQLRTDKVLREFIETNARESMRGDFGLATMKQAYRDALASHPRHKRVILATDPA